MSRTSVWLPKEMAIPKMEAPAEVRSATGELDTSIPGVTFGGDDLPVIAGNDGYPYCNVAMYLHSSSNPKKDIFGQQYGGAGLSAFAFVNVVEKSAAVSCVFGLMSATATRPARYAPSAWSPTTGPASSRTASART